MTNLEKELVVSFSLSAKEAQVAALLCRGLSNKEVANLICRAEKTVKWHVTHVFRKLGVKSRFLMILKFMEKQAVQAILQAPPPPEEIVVLESEEIIKLPRGKMNGQRT